MPLSNGSHSEKRHIFNMGKIDKTDRTIEIWCSCGWRDVVYSASTITAKHQHIIEVIASRLNIDLEW
jgi:hypothetical protein